MSDPADRRSSFSASMRSMSGFQIQEDAAEFSEEYDPATPPAGVDLSGHDRALLGPKVVVMDAFLLDLLDVDTSAQTFRLKLLLNLDWEDDGTIEPETRDKRRMGGVRGGAGEDKYRTGRYTLKEEFREDPLETTWNPEVTLVNALADEEPIESGSKFHSVQMLSGRPVISRSMLYQPECRCEFTIQEFPFDETDLVVKFSSNKWSTEEVEFVWSHRLRVSSGRATSRGLRASVKQRAGKASSLQGSVDCGAIGGVGLSEFEIVQVRVETEEKDINSMQRYDNAQGAFGQFHLIIRVRRDPYSYLLRVMWVAELLMFLEVLSFLVDVGDNDTAVNLADRFSISGTIFLAMVELYGEMSSNLPKVSVVTRTDQWHLSNFFYLFLSNVENLLAFSLRNRIPIRVMEYGEMVLAILYFVLVVRNLVWYLQPLSQREDVEDRVNQIWKSLGWLELAGRGKGKGKGRGSERKKTK